LHFPTLKVRGLVAAIAVAVALGACSLGTQAGGGGASDMTLKIASPANGAEVSIPFDVRLESSVPLGAVETGNHHAHLYFDTDTSAADYDIVYGNSWQVTRSLSPGKHTIIAALANPDHSLAGPTQTISVTVTGSGPGGGSAAPPSPSSSGYGY
jgi:hypothetical protein